ncbi:MAG: hypothetical protein M1818_007342 [Claussenomyces sp. TS43310]|nr:MAG: hypothetical protein M1818_007342 [Claussenomyces sp. TS43310]
MARSAEAHEPALASFEESGNNDPFLSAAGSASHHRYSHFDTQLFAMGPTASPEQAKRALEAHLAETERRIQEASNLGTTLVHQRKELSERLKEVETQQNEADISPELRKKLLDIEKEYNEVGRESARAFLPKSRVTSTELGGSSPLPGEAKRSISPSKFESQATNSPSKLSVPNRKQRNQPSTRVHDIEFATEISTSLLSQVRHLQTLLAEKDESLRTVTLDKSRLETEAEGFQQRLRSLDESEHRYKDENWNLETQIHEHIATAKEAADREKKMTQSLMALQAEKSTAQKELDEIKLSHARLAEEHAAAVKHHDVELGGAKRNITMIENERGALQRRIEELVGQNQELAAAVAQQRGRSHEDNQTRGLSDEDFEAAADNLTPEHSPPPSPSKGTPRHSMLESETLKSSLHHAHRMIQSLKNNIHREKTEKLELKRMLQDARDEVELKRGEGTPNTSAANKRKKVESKDFKKPLRPGYLGGSRSSRSEVFLEDTNWEDANGQPSPTSSSTAIAARIARGDRGITGNVDSGDAFETANETSDAFETANERGTETEDFHTGAEDMSGSDELTETEGGRNTSTIRKRGSANVALNRAGNRNSFQSTASLSGDEYSYGDIKTPVQAQPQRMRLKVNRGSARRSRIGSEEPNFASSPASFANSSNNGTPQAASQTLFAELEDLGGSNDEDSLASSPSRKSPVTPDVVPKVFPLPSQPIMIDSSTMTDEWNSIASTPKAAAPQIGGEGEINLDETKMRSRDGNLSATQQVTSDAASQWHEEQLGRMLSISRTDIRPVSTSAYSDMSSQYDPDIDANLAQFPTPPESSQRTPVPSVTATISPLSMSTILSEHTEPESVREAVISHSESSTVATRPMTPPIRTEAPLAYSSIQSVGTEPFELQSPLRSPRRDGVIIPRDDFPSSTTADEAKQEEIETSKPGLLGSVFGWGGKTSTTPRLATEDKTVESLSETEFPQDSKSSARHDSLSSRANQRSLEQRKPITANESSQTALTSADIETILEDNAKKHDTIDAVEIAPGLSQHTETILPTLRVRKSQDSVGSGSRVRSKLVDPDLINDALTLKRPGSVSSNRGSIINSHPPLPVDHKQLIAAAAHRVGSSGGGQGTMGPPLVPASVYRANPSFRPRTPSQSVLTPSLIRAASTTPRATHSSAAEVQSPIARSRQSSVSSFASEIDTRFNMGRNGMPIPHGMQAGADPRMIQAITQTMIGEYLWKYTRKAGRGEMSENRHRRYFWVHPYTRTLYWSDRDPAQGGRAELKAKSVAIDAVRVVTDDNPMPPGLHRKSLVILTPGRTIKFTATTGQRHETWFNALSYLLLRTEDGGPHADSENAVGGLTREDVEEFNPGYGSNSRSIRRGPASLSSYNSRTTRNESPTRASIRASLNPPTLNQSSVASRPPPGTFSRISNYWKPGKDSMVGSFSSRRSRHSLGGNNGSIYEASEVHDSAEDLREIIEKQDRESDRLENVRACCDGKLFNRSVASMNVSKNSQANTTSVICTIAQKGAVTHRHSNVCHSAHRVHKGRDSTAGQASAKINNVSIPQASATLI